jgi:CheY-like chemotaxis protein
LDDRGDNPALTNPDHVDPPYVRLAKILVWPACLIVFLLIFMGPIGDLINRVNTLDVSKEGLHVQAQQIATSAGAAGFAAGVSKAQEGAVTSEQALEVSRNIGRSFASAAPTAATTNNPTVLQGRILWVDEHPANNLGLSNAFQDLGIKVIEVASTAEAIDQLKQSGAAFDTIITSMTRNNDNEDGLKFIAALQKLGVKTPVIIYAAHWAAQNTGQEQKFGVQAITNDPSVVYKLTIQNVRASQRPRS